MRNESSFFSLFLCQNKGQIFLEPFFFLLGGGEAAVGNMSRSRGLYPLGVQTSTRYRSSAGIPCRKLASLSELRMILLGLFLQQRSYSTTRAAVERALLRLMNF